MDRWKHLSVGLLLLGTACARPEAQRPASAGAPSCAPGATSVEAPPGKIWWQANRWRFSSDEQATKAYRELVEKASPWPDWYVPYETKLQPGTRFQMAIGGRQQPETPGNFGTFDNIGSVENVRENLAVRNDWKPQVDRVVTYEVVQPFPVRLGPIGPQVDPARCAYLPGRWSQFEALVERGTLITYLRVVDVRPIH